MELSFADLIQRVIQKESTGNPNAVNSRTGAAGLMQVMPATAADPGFGVAPLNWDNRFDPQANQAFGEAYLGAMLERYDGDHARALAAYNWGPGNADKWDGDLTNLPEETRNYVNVILSGPAQDAPPPNPGMLPSMPASAAPDAPMRPGMLPAVRPQVRPAAPVRPAVRPQVRPNTNLSGSGDIAALLQELTLASNQAANK